MINILIADAQLLAREGLKSILNGEADFEIVCEVENKKQLEKCIKNHQIDVVIIDYAAESQFSVSDVGVIKKHSPNTNILVISSDNDTKNIHQVINFGTKGFLTKECDKDEVIGAIKAVAKGEKFFCSKVIDIVFTNDEVPSDFQSCAPTKLSTREIEIMGMVAKGLTTAEISEKLSVSAHTVSTHRKNILRKLNIKSPLDLIKYALNSNTN